jgi:meso-butanediol dehydrogenase/(S,S)-butanediol dehydrogenase/diacetyl reductase
MVANAGIGPPQDFLETTAETMDAVYEVNIRGVMFCYQAAAKQMIKQGGGGRLIGEYGAEYSHLT